MHKKLTAAAAVILSLLLMTIPSGCSSSGEDSGIVIPIPEGGGKRAYTTAEAGYYDLSQTATIGGGVAYSYAETFSTDYDANLLSYNVKKGDRLSEGDIIAEFDSSALARDYQNQKIVTDAAYSRYMNSGSEAARLEYETLSAELDLIQYRIDRYTFRAPYDCVITDAPRFETGQTVAAGTQIVSLAKPDEIFFTVSQNKDLFSFGTQVELKFGAGESYPGRVVSETGTGGSGRGASDVLIRVDDDVLDRINADIGNVVSAGWVTVIVPSFSSSRALCVPSAAVTVCSGSTCVYLDKDGQRVRVPVETGETAGDLTIILSGLAEGDIVSY